MIDREPAQPLPKVTPADSLSPRPILSHQGDPPSADTLVTSGAGFGIRLVARLIDTVYGLILGLLAGALLGVLFAVLAQMGKIDGEWIERVGQSSWPDYVMSAMGALLYHSLGEGIGGVTIGKLACGLRVVRRDGGAVDVEAGFKRSLAYYWDALFLGVVAYTRMERGPLRQRYGDAWADTVVVKKTAYRSPTQQGAGRIVSGVLLGSFLWAALVGATVCVKVW